MQFPRLPAWLTYGAVVAAIALAALGRREHADAPPAPPPLSKEEGALLSPASTFDHTIVIKSTGAGGAPNSGSAFSVGVEGVWLTARHVVDGCARIVLMEAPGRGAVAHLAPAAQGAASDVAVLTTEGGAPALALASAGRLRIGERGFHPGFPAGAPGEATSRLLGRQTLVRPAHARLGRIGQGGPEPVLAWALTGRTDGLGTDLSGLSGAPVLNSEGVVVGVTLAQSVRRGRIYSSTPEATAQALLRAGRGVTQPLPTDPVTVENYGRASDTLRRDLRVVQVVCLGSA